MNSNRGASRTLFLAPVMAGFGMSSITLGFLRALEREGVTAGYVKPVADVDVADDEVDRSVHFARTMCGLTVPDPIPAARAAQLIRDGNLAELLEEIVDLVESARGDRKLVVVEGLPPSLEHPLMSTLDIEIPRNLNAEVVAIVCGRHADAAPLVEAVADATHRYSEDGGPGLAGVLIARAPERRPFENFATQLTVHGLAAPLIGVVVDNAAHSAARLIDFVQDLGLGIYRRGKLDRARVTNIVVAALGPEKLVTHLRPGTLVVTPGDRADAILTTALVSATGMPLAGLLLTCGDTIPPTLDTFLSQRSNDLPIITTPLDTYDAAVALSTFDRRVRAEDHERMERLMDSVADQIDVAPFARTVVAEGLAPMTPPMFRHRLIQGARQADCRIVLPEGDEPRTIRAAAICTEKRIARCVLLAPPDDVRRVASMQGIELPDGLEIIDPAALREAYVAPMLELSKSRGISADQVRKHLDDSIVLGTMMLAQNDVDGLVSGAVHTTAATVRPALRLIRTAPGSSIVSSVFFMLMPDQVLVYGDCAINPDPNAEQLAEIAMQSADSARAFGIDPRIAMISYSTGSSAEGELVDKVRTATNIVRERRPDLVIDGPIQYDAASVESVGRQKLPGSPVAGRATVFVFPDLNTGNTTYKAVQRSANVVSVGPLLQGLRKPVNDLSRGALVDDIVYTIAMTAIQAAAQRR